MKEDLMKVVFYIQEEEEVYVETPWVEDLGDGRYRMDNCPFYFYDVAFADVIAAEYSDEEERLVFVKVLERSGHKLVRILFENPANEAGPEKEHLEKLVAMGCSHEGANPKYVCIDIPPEVELGSVTDYLLKNELTWEHAAPSYEALYPEER